jgi:LacI family transcriptional regulator
MVTIYDIAKEAKVSPATVSRVLNGQGNVKEETARKVQKIAKAKNYSPNVMARSLRTKRSNLIGLIIPDIENPIYPAPVRGIQDLANLKDYSVIIHSTDGDESKELETIRRLISVGVDGLIINISESSALLAEEIHKLRKAGQLPIVALGPWHPQLDIDCVSVDNEKGAYLAAEHLIKAGRREIAMISGPEGNLISEQRLEGFRKAMTDYCVPVHQEIIIEGNYKMGSGYQATKYLLEKRRLDAIFCANDLMALGAMRAIGEAGFKIPEEIALIGFDDIELAALASPPLSSITQPKYETGKLAAELLFRRIEDHNHAAAKYYSIEPHLAVRETTMRVRQMTS